MERKHSIGWAIDQVCKTKKIPRVRLAEVTGRDPGTITKWLNYNKPIGSNELETIADFIGVPVSELYRIAETGQFLPSTAEDQRRANLKAMVDVLNADQLDLIFRGLTADSQHTAQQKVA